MSSTRTEDRPVLALDPDSGYAKRLAALTPPVRPWPTNEDGSIALESCFEGGRFGVLVEKPDAVVVYAGADVDPRLRPFFDRLAELLIGQTLQEAREHGVARLESELRDFDEPPVPGVVQPDNAPLLFATARDIIRDLHDRYRAQHFAPLHENRQDPVLDHPATDWSTATPEERIDTVETLLSEQASGAGGVTQIVQDHRVFIAWTEAPSADDEPVLLRRLERTLRREVDPRLEVFLEPRPDRNWLRRRKAEREQG